MVHSVRYTCVLDTNIIYPLEVRDIMMWFAYYELFTPKWSATIFTEWKNVMERKRIAENEIQKRISILESIFPDAEVKDYQELVPSLELPDPNDRHVLAAAIKANAHIIVTNNLKDFPESYLSKFGIKAISADDFLTDLIDLNTAIALEAFKALVLNRTNPEMNAFEVLDIFRSRGLTNTANYLHAIL